MTKRIRFAAVFAAIFCLVFAAAVGWNAEKGVSYAQQLWTDVSAELPPAEGGEYRVATPEQFAALVKKWNEGNLPVDVRIILTASLDFSGNIYVPLGTETRPFAGTLRGAGYTIGGITYAENADVAAPVAYLATTGIVTELGAVTETDLAGHTYSGGIAGFNEGRINDCFALNSRYAVRGAMGNNGAVGGIAAVNRGKIYNSYAGGEINLEAASVNLSYGGIAGRNEGVLAYVYSTEKTLWKEAPTMAGGVVGNTQGGLAHYAYYLRENSLCQSAMAGVADIDTDYARVTALSGEAMGTQSVETMFPASGEVNNALGLASVPRNWTRGIESADGSSYYAPVLPGFAANAREATATAAQIRRYGIAQDGVGEWGTEENPYLISTTAHWAALAENVNRNVTYEGKFFKLLNDLNFEGQEAPQIGGHALSTGDRAFRGTFDGDHRVISDFRLEPQDKRDYTGLFGYVDREGTVKNLIVERGEVVGTRYVGVVAGYLTGRLENVWVKKSVSVAGNAYLGGIVGESRAGTLVDVLGEAVFAPYSGASGIYGIAGAVTAAAITNCWYVTDSASPYKDAGCGATLLVDVNGTVTAEKSALGVIRFTAEADSGWFAEYRTEREEMVNGTAVWMATDYNGGGRIYVRFVKTVNFRTDDGIALATESAKYYQGQSASLLATPLDGYYLSGVTAYRTVNGQEQIDPSTDFSYGTDREGVRIYFTVNSEVRTVETAATRINAPSVASQNDERLTNEGAILYNGEPVRYSYAIDGYSVTYNWSNGAPPSNVGNGTYTLTVNVFQDGVQRGYERQTFIMAPRAIVIGENALTKEKEFDGRAGGESVTLPVDTALVTGLVPGDSVFISSRAYFGGIAVTEHVSVHYEHIISGAASGNYYVGEDSVVDISEGVIRPKTVVIVIREENLKKTFDESPAAIFNFGYYGSYEAVYGYPIDPRFRFTKTKDSDGQPHIGVTENFSDAGYYHPEVYDLGSYAKYYNLMLYPKFAGLAMEDHYEYVIEPAKVKVTFDNVDGRIYTGEEQSISGYYYGSGASHPKIFLTAEEIAYTWDSMPYDYENPQEENLFLNAGEYTARAVLRGNYRADTTDGADKVTFSVAKAQQETISLSISGTEFEYGCEPVPMTVHEGKGKGLLSFVIEGPGKVLNGNVLDFTGDGEVTVTAVKSEGINYLGGRSETLRLTVSKRAMTVSLNDLQIKYGDPVAFSFFFDGLANRDRDLIVPNGFMAPTVYVDGVAHTEGKVYDVKTYRISLSSADTCTADGYDITVAESEKEFTVLRRAVTVTANSVQQVYGDHPVPLRYTVTDGDEVLDFILNGTLVREAGDTIGSYAVTAGTVTQENNPNVDLTFVAGNYTITPRTVTITVKPLRKTYGQPDPTPEFVVSGLKEGDLLQHAVTGNITREPGENAYTDTTDYGYYRYLSTELVVDENYSLRFVTVSEEYGAANLYIDPATPTFGDRWQGEIRYGSALASVFPEGIAYGVKDEVLQGVFAWAQPETTPDFSDLDTLTFEIVFTPSDRNYIAASTEGVLTVTRQEISLTFSGSKSAVYNGKAQEGVTYTFTGVSSEETVDAVAEWSDTPKDVGTYRLTVSVPDRRYILRGENTFTLQITPAVLEIGVRDVRHPAGQTPEKEFYYRGFVGGEDEKALTALPNVNFHTEAGSYKVTPFGAAAKNYTIRYLNATEVVTKAELVSEGFHWQGEFAAGTAVTVATVQEEDEAYAEVKKQWLLARVGGEAANYEISALYAVSIDGNEQSNAFTRAGFVLPEEWKNETFQIVVFKANGTAAMVEAKVEGDTVWFNASDMTHFAIVAPVDYTLYYIIGGAAAVVLLAAVIGVILLVKARKRKKEREEAQILADYRPR